MLNAEKYLERCLKSVSRATEKLTSATEILLIDNSSTDKTLEIAKRIAKELKNVQIFKCRKEGAAAARNFGMKMARGKYVWFIDVDDEIAPESIVAMITEAKKKNADLVMMGAKRVYSNGSSDYLSAVKAGSADFKSRFVRYGAGPWQFLIRREWWNKNKIAFHEGIIHEDMELMSSLILITDKFASVDKPLYIYYQNDDSVLHKKAWDGHAFDIFPALEGLYEKFKKAGAEKTYHDELEWFFIWNLLIDSAKDFLKFPEGKPGFKRSREMLSKYFPNWRKNRFLRQKNLKLKIRVRLNYYR